MSAAVALSLQIRPRMRDLGLAVPPSDRGETFAAAGTSAAPASNPQKGTGLCDA